MPDQVRHDDLRSFVRKRGKARVNHQYRRTIVLYKRKDSAAYPPGSEFWRMEISHFTPHDFNFSVYEELRRALREIFPWLSDAEIDALAELVLADCIGSYVKRDSRIFHDDILIPGTGLDLHYASNRVQGYKPVIVVQASGDEVPSQIKRIIIELEIAGRTFTQELTEAPLSNKTVEFVWDGLDALGRRVNTTTMGHLKVGYVYEAAYMKSSDFAMAFANFGSEISTIPARSEAVLWQHRQVSVPRTPEAVGNIADGWTVSAQHYMSPVDTTTLFKGYGVLEKSNISIVDTIAGNGLECWEFGAEPLPATESPVPYPSAVLLDPEGNLYVASQGYPAIRKIDREGNIHIIAGGPEAVEQADGIFAAKARLRSPCAMDMDAAGNLYVADYYDYKVKKIDKNGIITTVAGNGLEGGSGDGGPAVNAQVCPTGVAVGPNGSLYIVDGEHGKVRKVDQNGNINTVAGGGDGDINELENPLPRISALPIFIPWRWIPRAISI